MQLHLRAGGVISLKTIQSAQNLCFTIKKKTKIKLTSN